MWKLFDVSTLKGTQCSNISLNEKSELVRHSEKKKVSNPAPKKIPHVMASCGKLRKYVCRFSISIPFTRSVEPHVLPVWTHWELGTVVSMTAMDLLIATMQGLYPQASAVFLYVTTKRKARSSFGPSPG
uniref:hypothetical protein n=1 Tax=Neorhizobium sp. EC2-8 TaxID=3129230 RepID=UPI0031013CC3